MEGGREGKREHVHTPQMTSFFPPFFFFSPRRWDSLFIGGLPSTSRAVERPKKQSASRCSRKHG